MGKTVKKDNSFVTTDKIVALGIVAVLIVLALAVCAILAYFIPQTALAPQEGQTPQANQTNTQTQSNSTGITQQDFSLWLMITKPNVESACLNAAKQQAGSSAWAVQDCSCQESVTPNTKQYNCTVGTADPTGHYFANINCSLVTQVCSVQTNYGNQDLTFAQLRQYSGG